MLGILIGLAAVSLVSCDECQFSRDCDKVQRCKGIQDAGCVCKFGRCSFEGNPFFRGKECNSYEDCSCKNTPETCFCKSGLCKDKPEDKYECHKKEDCKKMAKCKGKDCNCSGNLCEFDCNTTEDCIKGNFYCSTVTGYTCKCEKNLCEFEQLKPECNVIETCVAKGKCTADKGCACTNNQCVKPWWAEADFIKKHPTKNCRWEEDCDSHFVMCKHGKCKCDNYVQVDEYSSWGECTLKN